MSERLVIEPLARSHHDRAGFDCGKEVLNIFLRNFARQNDEKGLGRTYVLAEAGQAAILGYYTISTGEIEFDDVPKPVRKGLPSYPIPVSHIGRLAIDKRMQGKGFGTDLLIDAFRRTLAAAEQIGIHAVEVVALDDEAKRFYLRFGFVELLDDPLHLYLAVGTIRQLGL